MIKPFQLPNGQTIYVEVEEAEIQNAPVPRNTPSDLPPGAEPTSVMDDLIVGSKLLQETIAGTAQSVYDSLKNLQPDEWSVELNIGLKGKATIIPVLVSSEGEGSIKVTAKWKKPQPEKKA